MKEASIVTRPEVSDAQETEDWKMIDDILHSPRSIRLSQSFNDETVQSPENDGHRAVLRRIDGEDIETSAAYNKESDIPDRTVPVLEHVVTPTFARTVDHEVVDEVFSSMLSEDTLENEPGNPILMCLLKIE